MPPKLWRYYLQATLTPAIISLLAVVIYLIYDRHWGVGANYKSEWITADALDGIVLFYAFIHALVFSIVAASIFFNRKAAVRDNPIYSLLAWVLLPLGYLLFLAVKSADDDIETIMTLLCVTLPYLFCLIFSFIRFRRKIKLAAPKTSPAAG